MAFHAYSLKRYQISAKSYADTAAFNVTAKVAPGATAEQVKGMLRNLLAERFKLVFHYDKKELPVYDLVVAKGGLKMREPAPEAAGAAPPPFVSENKLPKDADGFPIYTAPRGSMRMFRANGLERPVGAEVPVATLVSYVENYVGRPVIDSTGVTAKYDFIVNFASESLAASGPAAPSPSQDGVAPGIDDSRGGLTILAALEKQLGLRLEPTKAMVDVFVIDHAEKAPTEN
jgi:uncharacterized protein (TIGR03435 family)